MFRFDRMIRPSMTVREIRTQHPETAGVFESLGFRSACDDCSLDVAAARQGMPTREVLTALDLAIINNKASSA